MRTVHTQQNYNLHILRLWPQSNVVLDPYICDADHDATFSMDEQSSYFDSFWWKEGDPIWITAVRQVEYRYNTVTFLQNTHNGHLIARPWGRLLLFNSRCFNSRWFNSIVAMLYQISWFIGLCYNGTHWASQDFIFLLHCEFVRFETGRCKSFPI